MSIDCLSNWTVVKAVRPSLETAPPSASGSGTADTSGSFCSAAIDFATCALLAGSLSLPESVVKTTWLCAPAAGRELRLQQIDRLLRLGAGDREVLWSAAALRADDGADDDDGEDEPGETALPVGGQRTCDGGEQR